MKTFYVTIFDINYVVRALALYRSMSAYLDGCVFTFFCVDDESADFLEKMNLPDSIFVRPADYETPLLKEIRNKRSRGPYCWTLKSFALSYGLTHYPEAEWLVYIDADMMAFSDPQLGLTLDPDINVVLTPHRFSTDSFRVFEKSVGRYNAGVIAFRNTRIGAAALKWWQNLCIEECTAKPDGEMCGDQKYLDDMSKNFSGIHDSEHFGLNAAPWNIQAYTVSMDDGTVRLDDVPLLLYHFQGIRIFSDCLFDLYAGHVRIPRAVAQNIYRPYMHSIARAFKDLQAIQPDFAYGAEPFLKPRRQLLFYAKQFLTRTCNLAFIR